MTSASTCYRDDYEFNPNKTFELYLIPYTFIKTMSQLTLGSIISPY